jgi:NDP-sugar pyrophosphorylase family protein
VKAIVLVGGEGTRLRPLTYTTPKPLLPVANQPFVERQLHWLAQHGIDEIVLSIGYLPDAFTERYPDGRLGELRVRYAVEEVPLGTAGAIRYAAEIAGIDDRFVVCNGDVLTNLDLSALISFHEERGAEATISLTQVSDPSRFGVVPTRDDGRVLAFVEKPEPGRAPTNWINAGTYVLEPAMLDRIPPGVNVSIERVTFPRMLEHGGDLYAVRSDAYWLDMGVPQQYLAANADVLAGVLGLPPSDRAQEHRPGVWSEGPVLIDDSAVIEAPVLFGAGCVVGADAQVGASVLGPDTQVGDGAAVRRSVVLEGASIGGQAIVEDSVLGVRSGLGERAAITGGSVVGADAVVSKGTSMAGARVNPPGVEG